MNNLEAINTRISRRNFLNKEIENEKLINLKEKIAQINDVSGLTIAFIDNAGKSFNTLKGYGMFKGVNSVIVLKGDKNLPHLKEKSGYYGEIIILEATKMDLSTCWVGATYDKQSRILSCKENEEIICVIPIGYSSEKQSLRENIIRKGARRKSKSIEEMINSDQVVPDWFYNAMEYVQKAPTAKNAQKVEFTLKNNVVTASIADDYYLDLVDLGICKLHFEYAAGGKFELGNNASWNKG